MNHSWNWIEKSFELEKQNKKFAIATVTNVKGSTPREIGAKIIIVSCDEFYGTIGGGALEAEVIKKTLDLLEKQNLQTHAHRFEFKLSDLSMVCGGNTEVIVEIINSNQTLYLFGAGHCALALSHAISGLPFNLHVIDERASWLQKFGSHVTKHQMHWRTFAETALWSKDETFVVIMTPGHCDDRDILEYALTKPTKYLGMIGSKSKWVITKAEFLKNGISEERIADVHCPIGLPLGGKSPEEIAISIAAELIQCRLK